MLPDDWSISASHVIIEAHCYISLNVC